MTEGIEFILAFHNHQPVGNFENVFREAFEKCYDPFLRFLEEHPSLRVCLHYSGCLFDWLEAREKSFLKRLKELVRKNQVEMLGGGYYEPVLPLIPERDAVRQLRFMNRYLKRRFGKTPSGFWLTERVWEPKIPRIAAEAGLSYTAVDDTHFALAGFAEDEISEFFVTEEEGSLLYIFPVPKFLRYAIPFQEPEQTLDYLKQRMSKRDRRGIVTYADDGEKFGLWPGTYSWVYEQGWLVRFARALEENRSWITLKTFGEILTGQQLAPTPLAYLPTASYEEMTEWAQNREKGIEFQSLKRELESLGLWNRARSFFQGGTFKNFYAKYSEANWMRGRMQQVSRGVAKIKGEAQRTKAEKELWQAQCNCPYWHGVFGGLYLHHLRRETYKHLVRAEEGAASKTKSKTLRPFDEDVNHDGADEWILRTSDFSFFFLPHRGGALGEIDFLSVKMNVLDTLTRREEVYHRQLVASAQRSSAAGKSIHEIGKSVSGEVLERMALDSYERYSLLEHFLPLETKLEDFWRGKFSSFSGDPTRTVYEKNWTPQKDGGILKLGATISLEQDLKVGVEKKIQFFANGSRFHVHWMITNLSSKRLDCLWGSEWNTSCFSRERDESTIKHVEIQDGWSEVDLAIVGSDPFDYWQFPIETVAQTEKDFRLMHQGLALFPHWRLSLNPRESFERELTFEFSRRR